MNIIKYDIKRETSKYNKYMKWNLNLFKEDGSNFGSRFFKTERDAKEYIELAKFEGLKGFPIGDRMAYYQYIPKN